MDRKDGIASYEQACERSPVWRERWAVGVREGLKQAERGEFASDEEIAAVLDKYNRAQPAGPSDLS
jgi:predicted transcriptional regulator